MSTRDTHSIRVLDARSPADCQHWEELARTAAEDDVYYLPSYVRANEGLEKTQAKAIHLTVGDKGFLVPFLLRSFSDAQMQDAFTPYGYGGVLLLPGNATPTNQQIQALINGLREFCRENGLVTFLLRLHPLSEWLGPLRDCVSSLTDVALQRRGCTSAINLSRWDKGLGRIGGLGKGRASDLAMASRNLRVSWNCHGPDSRKSHLQIFQAIYSEAMRRAGADSLFHFPSDYFERLDALGDRMAIAVAWHGSDPVGAAMFLRGERWAHYHLAGSTLAGRRLKAATFLLNQGARWASEAGCELLHLGGGLREGDSLATFKRSFGDKPYDYYTLSVLVDLQTCRSLCSDPAAPWPYPGLASCSSLQPG